MMWWLLLLPFYALAEDMDLSAIEDLRDKLPTDNLHQWGAEDIQRARIERRFLPPNRPVSFQEIEESGTEVGSLQAGVPLVRLSDNSLVYLPKAAYLRHYKQDDEHGYKYIVDKNGNTDYKVKSDYVVPIKKMLALHEPPTQYTPAPSNIFRTEYDKKLRILPEVSFYAGLTMGNYMQDLFNDKEARSGFTTQYGGHFYTEWELPVKIGAVFHYERTTYGLTGGGKIHYSAFSFGPQFKSKDFQFFKWPLRVQTQFRIGPFAEATAETTNGEASFKFNSTDLLTSLELPVTNSWGQFVLGAFVQMQWLNLRGQDEIVSVRASNVPNTSFGLSLSQVFN